MEIRMPEEVIAIIETIQAAGQEAYAVGGCVRDSILGRIPDDWDITTSAKPEQVKELFPRTVDTGLQHGTITVLMGKEGFEVTTYRIDGEYEDGRHPKEVVFTASLEEDLKRRDFTINAMAYHPEKGLVDLFGGQKDLQQGMIRCVGDPSERFGEDALRMMRAVRFSAQLGYEIEEETCQAIKKLAGNLNKISAERIQVELSKLLCSPHPDYLRKAYELGLTKVFLPEFDETMACEQNNPHHCYTVGEHTLHSLVGVSPEKVLRLTMLFHDFGKPQALCQDESGVCHFHGHAKIGEEMAKKILRRLKFDNDTIRKVAKLVLFHDYGNGVWPDGAMVRKAVHQVGEDLFPLLLLVKKADMEAQSEHNREKKTACLKAWEDCYQEVVENQECVSLGTLAVTGKDLMEAGMQPGKEMGETLQRLLEVVLEDPAKNVKDYLLTLIP